ncbi:MAG: Aminoglycoside phosphotransferase [Verrucomicrobia bacterium]|nr:Aminoglycoside phosphotransferase [Verrucomicrobiota bacterium]
MSRDTPEHAGLLAELRGAGLTRTDHPVIAPLPGGVSSEILRVTDGGRDFVVKRALAKLKVRDDWFADVSRSRSELAYLRRASAIAPGCTPRVLFSPPSGDWFAMEYLGPEFSNWKTLLLAGSVDPWPAREAGALLGRIHRATWLDPEIAREFATLGNFRQLRLEPYLATAARRVPDLAPLLLEEQERLAGSSTALVHGDFSPKNIMVASQRVILLDAEVAWCGDPAFDPAFLLAHCLLKSLLRPAAPEPVLGIAGIFWRSYAQALGSVDDSIEPRTTRLVLCLLLARVHGKSPVEYLSARQQTVVTGFVRAHLSQPPSRLESLVDAWRETLRA